MAYVFCEYNLEVGVCKSAADKCTKNYYEEIDKPGSDVVYRTCLAAAACTLDTKFVETDIEDCPTSIADATKESVESNWSTVQSIYAISRK